MDPYAAPSPNSPCGTIKSSRQNTLHLTGPALQPLSGRWVGYMIRRERQRRQVTQQMIAGYLGFGMSAISTIEAGDSYANMKRTLRVLSLLGIETSLCLAAVSAQQVIHRLLLAHAQREEAGNPAGHYPKTSPEPPYPPSAPVRVVGRPGPGLES